LDRAYNIPLQDRPFWYESVSSLLIVLSLGLVLLLVANLILFGQPLIGWLGEAFHLPVKVEHFLQMARWGLSIVSVIGCSTLIYGLLLKFKLKKYYWRAAAIGSLVFTALWFGLSLLFSLYIQAFSNYNPIYGSLGAIVFLMTWFYLSAMSILIAGEIISIIALPKEAVDIVEAAKKSS
jgi:membrane protein